MDHYRLFYVESLTGSSAQIFMWNFWSVTNISVIPHRALNIRKSQLFITKSYDSREYSFEKDFGKYKSNMKYYSLQRNLSEEVVNKDMRTFEINFNSACDKVKH